MPRKHLGSKQDQYERILAFCPQEFTQDDVMQTLGCAKSTAHFRIKEMEQTRLIHLIENHRPRKYGRTGSEDALPSPLTTVLMERNDKRVATMHKRAANEAAEMVEDMQEELNFLRGLDRTFTSRAPCDRPIIARTRSGREVCPQIVIGDVHAGEAVKPEWVNYLNEYNPTICEERMEHVARNAVSRIRAAIEGGAIVNSAIVSLLGDLITGFLHEDQQENNHMTPMEEIMFMLDLLIRFLDHLLDELPGLEVIDVLCSYGNHGRSTKKPRSAGASTSYEVMLYQMLAKHYADKEPRLRFTIATGYFIYHDIFDARIAQQHGDFIKGGGGIGGVTIPLNRRIAQWAKNTPRSKRPFHILGHFHQWLVGPEFFLNGSVVGYSPYALKISAECEEPQQGLLWWAPGAYKPVAFERIWCREVK